MIRPTRAYISREALRRNIARLRRELDPDTRMMGVVKADCYGHGVPLCLPTMLDEGIDLFGVATVNEAKDLRTIGFDGRVVLLTTPFQAEAKEIMRHNIEVLVSDLDTVSWIERAAENAGRRVKAHLYVDTGMTRNGASPGQLLSLAAAVSAAPSLKLQGYASHLATSEELDQTYALRQIELFDGGLEQLRSNGYHPEDVHICNSGGILNFPAAHHSLVRPGIALYGYHPLRGAQRESGLEPVLRLCTALSSVKRVPPGTSISYGRRFTTERETTIGTLPIGYGDGLLRGLGGKLEVLVSGKRYRVVGTICMDEIMVDLGPDSTHQVGDECHLLGNSGEERIDAWDMASHVASIPYEITTALAPRVPRLAPREDEESRPGKIISPFDQIERSEQQRPEKDEPSPPHRMKR